MSEVAYLKAECGVRYWEDATVNGVDDEDGKLIPCRVGDTWAPVIELATGAIEGWPLGVTAETHYKVCDDGRYTLLDAQKREVCALDGYVPSIMCPQGGGYGDYVKMLIGPDGKIADWDNDLDDFAVAYRDSLLAKLGQLKVVPAEAVAAQQNTQSGAFSGAQTGASEKT